MQNDISGMLNLDLSGLICRDNGEAEVGNHSKVGEHDTICNFVTEFVNMNTNGHPS